MSITPKKSLGQHFLTDRNIIQKIANAVSRRPGGRIVEIGPGTGAVTEFLFHKHPDLEVIEIDQRAVAYLNERFPGLKIHHQDILQTDWQGFSPLDGKISVIGNLPYYITSPILFSVLDNRQLFDEAVFMMQKEVADRIVANPGNKTYGILSVQTQLFSRPEYLFTVSRHVFNPKPNVESAVVKFHFNPDIIIPHAPALKKLIRTAFNQRRKTLSNAIKPILNEYMLDPDQRQSLIQSFQLERRAETLAPQEFVHLNEAIISAGVKNVDI